MYRECFDIKVDTLTFRGQACGNIDISAGIATTKRNGDKVARCGTFRSSTCTTSKRISRDGTNYRL